jgi:hypothetical protein
MMSGDGEEGAVADMRHFVILQSTLSRLDALYASKPYIPH